MVNNFTNINKTNNQTTTNFKPFITKKTTTYGAENPGPGTGKNIIHSYSCLGPLVLLLPKL